MDGYYTPSPSFLPLDYIYSGGSYPRKLLFVFYIQIFYLKE